MKKKSKALVAVGLVSVLLLSGCNTVREWAPGPIEDNKEENRVVATV